MTNMIRHRRRLLLKVYTAKIKLKRFRIDRIRSKQQQQVLKQFPIPSYDIPIQHMSSLSRQERKHYRKMYPNLPKYMFMNSHEKRLFLKRKDKEYERKLNRTPNKISPTKKSVSFEQQCQVRPFLKSQEAVCVSKTASFADHYHFHHFHY